MDNEKRIQARPTFSMVNDSLLVDKHFEGKQLGPSESLFELNENGVSQTAWACFVYSLVPYLGIIFVPLTITVGGFGVLKSYQNPWLGGRRLALVSLLLSFIVLAVQILLWWLLYIIPSLGREL